jgi:hypothetical protein
VIFCLLTFILSAVKSRLALTTCTVPVFQSSVTEHVGVVMGKDCGFIRKVLKSNVCRVINNHDTQWRSWLRHCATSRKIAGSISYDVTDVILATALWP